MDATRGRNRARLLAMLILGYGASLAATLGGLNLLMQLEYPAEGAWIYLSLAVQGVLFAVWMQRIVLRRTLRRTEWATYTAACAAATFLLMLALAFASYSSSSS